VAGGSNGGVNGVNTIEGGGEVKRWIKEGGSDGGVVKARAASEVELGGVGAAGGGGGATELGRAGGEG
jgi:hypothetical protein